jgi:hypothetical protein
MTEFEIHEWWVLAPSIQIIASLFRHIPSRKYTKYRYSRKLANTLPFTCPWKIIDTCLPSLSVDSSNDAYPELPKSLIFPFSPFTNHEYLEESSQPKDDSSILIISHFWSRKKDIKVIKLLYIYPNSSMST